MKLYVRFEDLLKKIEPFVVYYKRLIHSYNNAAHNILENEKNYFCPNS